MTGTLVTAEESRPHAAAARRRLVADTVPVSSLDRATIADAFSLFQRAYDGADRGRFEYDLAEKQLVILLRDRNSGVLGGFSTVLLQVVEAPRPATVVFSGDTVVDRAYWGQKQLQVAFARILVTQKLASPRRPVYWFLLSKGYRTYLLLANSFPRGTPRHDRDADPSLQRLLDRLATERYAEQYDPRSGVIRYATAHERVRAGVAPITADLLRNPHVRFFVKRNPGHEDGDELACLAEVRLLDLARIGARLTTALVRRSLRAGRGGRG